MKTRPNNPPRHMGATVRSWTPEEDRRLTAARELGMDWKMIAEHYLPGRTWAACANHHEYLSRMTREDKLDQTKSDAFHAVAAKQGCDALLRRQIATGQVFGVPMLQWQQRHGAPA